jgi:hypothetical protein
MSVTVRTKFAMSNGRNESSYMRMKGCCSSCSADGRCSGSLHRHCKIKSRNSAEKVSAGSCGGGSLRICESSCVRYRDANASIPRQGYACGKGRKGTGHFVPRRCAPTTK